MAKSASTVRPSSSTSLAVGLVSILELFWVDVTFQNPLDAEVSLSDITLVVDGPSPEEVEIEVVKELLLAPKQTVQVCNH